MDKFDDLFNKFFNRDEDNSMDDEAKKIINMINNIKEVESDDELDAELDLKLGKPHEIEYFKEDDMYYERRSWFMDHGVVIKTIASDEPLEPQPSLEEQLTNAIEVEDYLTAAKLRDQIKKDKAKAKRVANKLLKPELKNK